MISVSERAEHQSTPTMHGDDPRDIGQIPARPVIPAEVERAERQRQDAGAAEKMQPEGFESELQAWYPCGWRRSSMKCSRTSIVHKSMR